MFLIAATDEESILVYRAGRCGDHFVDDPILLTLEIMIAVLMITLVATMD